MHLSRRSKIAGKPGAIGHDAGQAFTTYRNADCRSGTAGKTGRIHTLIVDRETLMTIRQHRVPRIHDNVPWTIARVVWAQHDPSVFLRRLSKTLNRHAAPRTRVERVQHGPFPIRRVIRWEVEGVTLRWIVERFNSLNELASWDRWVLCDRVC